MNGQHPSADQLQAFAAGRTSEQESVAIEAHLADCPSCCTLLEEIPDDALISGLRLAARGQAALATPPPLASSGMPTVPGYEILSELGRGGMGVVYRAQQVGMQRIVALKMLLAGAHATMRDQARFQREAETIAALVHPGIVQVYEIGVSGGLPYLAMELVEGGNLASHLQTATFKPPEAAELVEHLARAIQVAHERGVIHRDLKPANILLASAPTAADSGARPTVPKITDFGLAKWLDHGADLTRPGVVAGTPGYMAPEQAASRPEEVGPAADIFALGAIFYELLAGRPAFHGATPLETVEQVRMADPVPPSRLKAGLPRDLETICLKCLEKNPARRYRTAGDLADDLRHFLNSEPIRARRVGELERLWLWSRRRPTVAALLLTCLLLDDVLAATLSPDGSCAVYSTGAKIQCVLAATGEPLWHNDDHRADVKAMTFSPDTTALATVAWDGRVRLLDAATGRVLRFLGTHIGPVRAATFSRDGRLLATAGNTPEVRLWDVTQGEWVRTVRGPTNIIEALAFSASASAACCTAWIPTALARRCVSWPAARSSSNRWARAGKST
jgi:serine/threonine protein kinase